MSIYDFVKDYFFPSIGICESDDISRMFLKSVSDRDIDQLKIWYSQLLEYMQEGEFDRENKFFNRMRIYINQEFNTHFEPVFFRS